VSTARPVEIFFFKVLFATQLADLLVDVEIPSILQLLYSLPHLVPLILERLHQLVRLEELILELVSLNCSFLQVILDLRNLFLSRCQQPLLVLAVLLHNACQLLHLNAKLVSIRHSLKRHKDVIKVRMLNTAWSSWSLTPFSKPMSSHFLTT